MEVGVNIVKPTRSQPEWVWLLRCLRLPNSSGSSSSPHCQDPAAGSSSPSPHETSVFWRIWLKSNSSSLQYIQTWGCQAVPSLSKKEEHKFVHKKFCGIVVRNRQKSRTFCEIYKVKRDRLFFPQVTIVSDYINQDEGRYPLQHRLSPFYNVISCKRQKLSQNSPPPSLIIWYLSNHAFPNASPKHHSKILHFMNT